MDVFIKNQVNGEIFCVDAREIKEFENEYGKSYIVNYQENFNDRVIEMFLMMIIANLL